MPYMEPIIMMLVYSTTRNTKFLIAIFCLLFDHTVFSILRLFQVRSPYVISNDDHQRFVKATVITVSNNHEWPYQVELDHLLPNGK